MFTSIPRYRVKENGVHKKFKLSASHTVVSCPCIIKPNFLVGRQHFSPRHYCLYLKRARSRLDKLTPLEKVGRGDSFIRSLCLSKQPEVNISPYRNFPYQTQWYIPTNIVIITKWHGTKMVVQLIYCFSNDSELHKLSYISRTWKASNDRDV